MYNSPHQGYFRPKNPKKYSGDISNIVYRSSLELRAMKYFDEHTDVLQWSSEETIIPYFDPVTQRVRRYFMDFQITCKTKAGEVVTYLVEVKPDEQTRPPIAPKKKTPKALKNYQIKVSTYLTNDAKWKAAEEACKNKNWKFIKLTEKHLRYQN